MITYLFLFSVPKLNLVLAKRLKGTAKKSIETALNRQRQLKDQVRVAGGAGRRIPRLERPARRPAVDAQTLADDSEQLRLSHYYE